MTLVSKHLTLWLAPLAGLIFTLAFAPYDYAYGVIAALMFFYYGCQQAASLKHAAGFGYLFGLGVFGLGIWWIYLSVHDAGGADAISSVLITLLGVTFFALFPALVAMLISRLLRWQQPTVRMLAAAGVWVVVEYLRGYSLLNGFPWLQIAYSQIATPLAGYAPLIGVYGIGFLLALSAFSLVELFGRQFRVALALPLLAGIWVAGGALQQQTWTTPIGEPVQISLIQGNISQTQKWQANQKLATLKLYQELTEQHWDSQVIIWPETAIPAFLSQVKQFFLEPLAETAKAHQTDLVVSLPSGDGKQYYNSVLVLGDLQTLYHKHHLLPFGEYLPLQPLSGWILDLIQIPLGSFTAGADDQTLLQAGGYRFITTICYEDAFGAEVSRQLADAAYLVNVTNDAWFGDSSQPYQHLQMAQMRALETGRYMVRATNTGVTAFIAPDGSVQSQAPLFTTTTLTDRIVPMGGLTPYAKWGDAGVFTAILAVLGLAVVRGGIIHKASALLARGQ